MPRGKGLLFLSKRRRWLYRKLVRIMSKVDEGCLPMSIREVYLFGGFLRNKEDPKDIDLLLIYDPDETLRMYEKVERDGSVRWKLWELQKSPSQLRRMLKKNSERSVDINICPSLEEYQKDLLFPMDPILRIWTREERDWRKVLSNYFLERQLDSRPLLARAPPASRSGSRYRSPRRCHGTFSASKGHSSLVASGRGLT
ncbi:MAG: hypothetical protein QW520_02560 [Methanomassiliicoccales archaeon]